VIVASSDKAYGQHRELPYHEDVALRGEFPYDVSKSCADLIAQSYSITYDLPVGIARCGNVFGGGDLNWSRLVPGTIRSALTDAAPVIRSDGSYLRDYIYVSDVVGGYLALAEEVAAGRATSRAYNFGNEEPVRVIDLVTTILRKMGLHDLEPEVVNTAKGEIHSQFLSALRARDELGWCPKYDLEGGLALTIDWYRDFLQC
jgi:CDP-glucose 4,6-dehydratase